MLAEESGPLSLSIFKAFILGENHSDILQMRKLKFREGKGFSRFPSASEGGSFKEAYSPSETGRQGVTEPMREGPSGASPAGSPSMGSPQGTGYHSL